MAIYRIEDQLHHRVQEVDGDLVAEISTQRPARQDRPASVRWNTLAVYDLTGSGRWLVHRVGWSDVYHRADTSCTTYRGDQSGHPATVEDLPDTAVPCEKCQPPYPQDLADGEPIRYEFARHGFVVADNANGVVGELIERNVRDAGTRRQSTKLSAPAEELIRECVSHSERFRRELDEAQVVSRIG